MTGNAHCSLVRRVLRGTLSGHTAPCGLWCVLYFLPFFFFSPITAAFV